MSHPTRLPFALLVILTGLSCLTGSARGAESPDDLLVIVNNAASINATTLEELQSVFLKRKSNWADGARAAPMNASEGTVLREAFRARVLQLTGADEAKHWSDERIRSGNDAPGETSVSLKAVFSSKNIVSYVFRSELKPGLVKVIATYPK